MKLRKVYKRILFLTIVCIAMSVVASCSRSEKQALFLSSVDEMVRTNPDSALMLLGDIDIRELKEDSLKAYYHMIMAAAHKANETPMVSDSMIRHSFEFYKKHDYNRFLKSGDLYSMYLFWTGNGKKSLALLDSMIALPDIPDDNLIDLLQTRIGIGGAEFDCKNNIKYIRHLLSLDKDSANQFEYLYQLCENYQYANANDSALIIIDSLIDYSRSHHLENKEFQYTCEKIGILEELGRYDESNRIVDYILDNAPHNSALPYLHFWKALNFFNQGNIPLSSRHLAIADSCAKESADIDHNYYESFAGPLREFLAYKQNNIIRITQWATLNNTQRDLFNRLEDARLEAEQSALRQENKALILKAQNERKTAIIIICILGAIILGLIALWNIQKRKRKIIEIEEKAEALQKMINELNASKASASQYDSLRRAMLQQLGIIKMVAETPTEQNQDLLRKVSSIEGDTNGNLVNWPNIYDIINNLYSDFHTRLHTRFGDVLSEKEEQIIVLMLAGFSTKEIGVITSQSVATIYVRKSSIRKKIGVPEKEDIISYLNLTESS